MRTVRELQEIARARAAADLANLLTFSLAQDWLSEETAAAAADQARLDEMLNQARSLKVNASDLAEAAAARLESFRLRGEVEALESVLGQRQNLITQLKDIKKPDVSWLK